MQRQHLGVVERAAAALDPVVVPRGLDRHLTAGKLAFIVHWKGGSHTAFQMEKANAKAVSKTAEVASNLHGLSPPSH